jgi:hypothetical protein
VRIWFLLLQCCQISSRVSCWTVLLNSQGHYYCRDNRVLGEITSRSRWPVRLKFTCVLDTLSNIAVLIILWCWGRHFGSAEVLLSLSYSTFIQLGVRRAHHWAGTGLSVLHQGHATRSLLRRLPSRRTRQVPRHLPPLGTLYLLLCKPSCNFIIDTVMYFKELMAWFGRWSSSIIQVFVITKLNIQLSIHVNAWKD